jgi:hypothetical protein
MDQNDKIADGKIAKMENEIKVLKNEVQAVLLNSADSNLNMENLHRISQVRDYMQSIIKLDNLLDNYNRAESANDDIIASLAIVKGVYPALSRSSYPINSIASKLNNQIVNQIEIINVSNNRSTDYPWVKKTGNADTGSAFSYWNYQLTENNIIWRPTVTNEINDIFDISASVGHLRGKSRYA